MRLLVGAVVVLAVSMVVHSSFGQDGNDKKPSKKKAASLSFKKDVFPIIQKNCLPCHAEDNFNPSELSMDDYDKMKAGGEKGPVWVEKNSKESLIIKKLSENPPFGDRMPLNTKRKIEAGKAKWLSEEEIRIIATWIDGGAKNN
ncbi:MAG: hypothetical protein HW412_111 [Bacteroidetes bacterium]|nr:hypothetical protein [Bacteroidota bacterium]